MVYFIVCFHLSLALGLCGTEYGVGMCLIFFSFKMEALIKKLLAVSILDKDCPRWKKKREVNGVL